MIIDSHQHVMLPTGLQFDKMKEAGIDKTILFCTTPHPEKTNTLEELKQEMQLLYRILEGENDKEQKKQRQKKNIDELLRVINQYPDQFLGFGGVPLGLLEQETSAWIEQEIIKNGLRGVGEFTPGNDAQMKQIDNVLKAASAYPGLPLWVHTFSPVSHQGIQILMELCKKYPTVPVIWGHLGGYHWMEVIAFAKEMPNVYLDLSATFNTIAVKMAITEVPERCLFSSDAPYGEPLLARQLIEYVSPSKEIAKMVLGENIMSLLQN